MLTYDRPGPELPSIEDLLHDKISDLIECGENNEVWVMCRRSTKTMELISKVDGRITKKVPVDQDFERIAVCYGIGPRQLVAVRAALKL